MGLEIKLSELLDIEHFVLVLNLGVLNAIEQGVMSTEEAYYYFYRPFFAQFIEKIGGHQELVTLLEDCCMLDDVKRLVPESLAETLKEYEGTTVALLNSFPRNENPKYWINKNLD